MYVYRLKKLNVIEYNSIPSKIQYVICKLPITPENVCKLNNENKKLVLNINSNFFQKKKKQEKTIIITNPIRAIDCLRRRAHDHLGV